MDEYGYVAPAPTSQEVKNLTRFLMTWKINHQQPYPEDVVNFMIGQGMITETEAKEIMEDVTRLNLDIVLPNSYLSS